MAVRLTIIGAGPAGVQAATYAARLGAEVTMVERDLVGGAANLWDCIPSKAMIATGGVMSLTRRAETMGLLRLDATLDFAGLGERIARIESGLNTAARTLLDSQGVRIIEGTGRLKGPHEIVVETANGIEELDADAVLVSTGSRPRIPDWADIDGERVLTTRQAYPPPELPEHLVVIGSGVTGVEFVHMFRSFGAQGHPHREPPTGPSAQGPRGGRGAGGRLPHDRRHPAEGRPCHRHLPRGRRRGVVRCDDGRVAHGSHALLAIGSIPNSENLASMKPASRSTTAATSRSTSTASRT